jgi:ribosome-binding factor A
MSVRNEKIASVIKKALSGIISKLAMEKNFGLASIASVQLSKDLSIAKIYINLLNLNY